MFKKMVCAVLVAAYLFSSAGCSGVLRKKFVREKKQEVKKIPVFKPQEYESEFNKQQLYANHFAFWRNAETEVIELLSDDERNYKKLKTYASYSLEELKQMQQLLIDEKQQQINPYIEELTQLVKKIKSPSYVSAHKHTLIKQLKHHCGAVGRGFSYFKMKNWLRK